MNHLLNLNNKNYNIMKKVVLNLTVLFFTLLSFSQVQEGIAVQGIARDANNTAYTGESVILTFEMYYMNVNAEVGVYTSQPTTVSIDSFGVFSHVITLGEDEAVLTQFNNRQLWLRISAGDTVISNEVFKRVPYAYAARKGVPTGSIMPFIGTTAPLGWLLCDGGDIEIADYTLALRDLLGGVSTTPNLQGMFLRGAGTSPLSTELIVKEGPELMSTQEDSNKSHTHTKGSLTMDLKGNHNHHITIGGKTYNRVVTVGVNAEAVTASDVDATNGEVDLINSYTSPTRGDHKHTITGNVGGSGGAESRPVNYGVNYIIKL
jgi:microcystin-dependent protein